MNGLLVRVAADQTQAGGYWNGPVHSGTGQFVYVSIPEYSKSRSGLKKPYEGVRPALSQLKIELPSALSRRHMHLDPDFEHLTYGDGGERAKQIRTKLGLEDLIVFYAGMRDINHSTYLHYGLIGLYVVKEIISARDVPEHKWHENAHTRRVLARSSNDIVVRAKKGVSGRMKRCIQIGEYRKKAYRVTKKLQKKWGGLRVNDGYIQRSARLPEFMNTQKFYDWFLSQKVPLIQANN